MEERDEECVDTGKWGGMVERMETKLELMVSIFA